MINGDCKPYNSPEVKRYLLQQLKKNKHVNMKKLRLPNQTTNNCWFNVFFVTLFISDGGRKFFHFFRTLMINGELSQGDKIPVSIRNGFALFNYCIESCLTGAPFVENLNTNVIVHYLYESMKHFQDIEENYGLPIHSSYGIPSRYLETMISYLSLSSIKTKMLMNASDTKEFLQPSISFPGYSENITIEQKQIEKYHLIVGGKPVHMIVLCYNKKTLQSGNKYVFLNINQYKYKLDSISCVARNSSGKHYCALITLNGIQYQYEGATDSHVKIKKCNWNKWLYSIYAEDFKFAETSSTVFNLNDNYSYLYYYRIK